MMVDDAIWRHVIMVRSLKSSGEPFFFFFFSQEPYHVAAFGRDCSWRLIISALQRSTGANTPG